MKRKVGDKIIIILIQLTILLTFIFSFSYNVKATTTSAPVPNGANRGSIEAPSRIERYLDDGSKVDIERNLQTGELNITKNGELTGGWAHLVEGLMFASLVVGVIQLLRIAGVEEKLTNALSAAAFAGIMTYKGLLALGSEAGEVGFGLLEEGNFLVSNAGLIGIGVAVTVFFLLYKKEKKRVVELQCLPWEAPLGGNDCEKCNQDPLRPCSEYRCKSLGQACELINKGSAEERCVWVSRNDVNSPTIRPWVDVLTRDHRYTDIQGRPPSRGTRITRNGAPDGCIKPFTPLQFGIILNEPAQCKIDLEGNKSFDSMQHYFGEKNFYRYNHTQQLRLPSPGSVDSEGIEVPTEGRYNFYVKCRDANGNVNEDEFLFQICVDKSPDTTPPVIEDISISSGRAVRFGIQQVPLMLLVNEPAECRWSVQDKTYDLMENNMTCSTNVYEQNARQQYPCTTNLTGIRDRSENVYYFRCKDQPSANESLRNTNQESYRFMLRGSQPLNILNVGPNGTFTGSTDFVQINLTVRTDDGANEGRALCYFNPTGREDDYIPMFETNSFNHRQTLLLRTGNYNYFFRCVDEGGNSANANTSFNILIDRTPPSITRVFKEGVDALRIITDEPAECRYSLNSCNFVFSEGLPFQLFNARDRRSHITLWRPSQSIYIKCRDNFGNEPNPNACSIVVSASSII